MSRLALVTGGQRGIGLGIARSLAADGFRLAITAEVAPDHPDVTAALGDLGEGASYHRHDQRNIADIDTLLERIEADAGPITTFVANAGVPARIRGDMLDITHEDYAFVQDVNVKGAFFLAQSVARRMLGRPAEPYRSMVFITSASAHLVSVDRAEYCISKAAASMMAQLFAVRLAGEGIGVFEVRPGIIETQMTRPVAGAYTPRIEGGLVPAKRWGTVEDVAAAVLPLVTGQMAFSQGAIIPVDGALLTPRL
ncbi:MAG: 3-ketoacyl-ACP reductase [Pseudomonadota bacterium]